jgi:hypothetical protein
MAWITLAEAHVEDRMTADELSSLKTISASSGGTPLADVISGVSNEIRGYVGAGGYPRGVSGTIPDELLEAAVAIIRYRLILRMPLEKTLLTPGREKDKDAALDLLRNLVATGKFGIEAPATAATGSITVVGPSMSEKTRNYERDDEDGI